MHAADFKRIIGCFLDSPASFDLSKGEFVVQLRDEMITASLERRDGSLFVVENDIAQTAERWLIDRVAKVPLLASRILEYIPEIPNLVNPESRLLRNLEDDPQAMDAKSSNALASCREILERDLPGTTSVTYLTSDAGEGKTTIINALARQVASDYKNRRVDWILLPIPLGGRAFLRFDELVVSTLVSKLRFPYWYFEGFVELVRMRVIVPAFDGFEEMIVEGSSGEAVSALGNLMNLLDSEGTVLFAARQAFFEYQSFKTQARLFDAIGKEDSVSFSRLTLERWSFTQFLEYGESRGNPDSKAVYDQVAQKFGSEHPLLTRAVLVRRLFDVASNLQEVGELLAMLGQRPQDYFHEFVLAIIQREAGEKWLDKEGREGQSLLTADQHLDLLSAVAREMWISSTDALRQDVIDVVADLYCEENRMSPTLSRQIRERLKHHALLVTSGPSRGSVCFDHEDFRGFFTGVALGKILVRGDVEEIRTFLRVSSVPTHAAEEALLIYKRDRDESSALIGKLVQVAAGELPTSFVVENVGTLIIGLLDRLQSAQSFDVAGLTFGANSLLGRTIGNVAFSKCYFAPTSLSGTHLSNVEFRDCRFERIERAPKSIRNTSFIHCEILSVVLVETETAIFEPSAVITHLSKLGFVIESNLPLVEATPPYEVDDELEVAERAIRVFLRATQVNEDTFRVKLGNRASTFFSKVLPDLERLEILEQVSYRGSGQQLRYRLSVPMTLVQDAISKSKGSFGTFLTHIRPTQRH